MIWRVSCARKWATTGSIWSPSTSRTGPYTSVLQTACNHRLLGARTLSNWQNRTVGPSSGGAPTLSIAPWHRSWPSHAQSTTARKPALRTCSPRVFARSCLNVARHSASAISSTSSIDMSDETQFRLPTDVKPVHYDITFRTDLVKETFDGFVVAHLDVIKETSTLTFHSSALKIGNATAQCDALKTSQTDTSRTFEDEQERCVLHFATPFPAGSKIELKIAFDGALTGAMMGYYKSRYTVDGKEAIYALTQFEPTAARRAFPCWDEPALKATFSTTLISRENTVSLANMPAISEEVYTAPASLSDTSNPLTAVTEWMSKLTFGETSEKWKITRFEKTPLVSTYLVAWANGPFEHLESSYTSPLSGKTKKLRIYATADNIKQAQYALDVKAMAMPVYEKIFDIEYPLPKLDTLIAADFDAGAMENWGLITGRTQVYCLDPERADITTRKYVASVQSHEVAHQWFGNITTMEWWDNLYLNEGFATLMGEVVVPSDLYPEWKVNTSFIDDHLQRALSLDAKLSSHPIEVPCPDANKANQIFDSLSYSKAGSVLRMLSNYVGEETFLKGVSIYLKKHLYKNTVSQNLWDGISEAAGHDVGEMMRTWVGKIGFPYITVTETPKGIHVRQDRFLETGPAKPEDNETIWKVPLSLLTVGEDGKPKIQREIVLDQREMDIELDTSKPFKLNAGTVTPIRVLYSPERLVKIAEEAAKGETVFSADDRIGLVNDASALAKAGFSDTSAVLSVANTLRHEHDHHVWDAISGLTYSIRSVWFENEKIVDGVSAFQRSIFSPLVDKLGYEFPKGEDPDKILLRKTVIDLAASGRDPKVIAELRSRFDHFLKTGDDSKMPADILATIYSVAVRHGGREEYEAMKKIHNNPVNPAAKSCAIGAMGQSPDPEIAKETLQFALDHGRDQDLNSFFGTVSSNPKTRRVVAQFFKDNYDAIHKRFEGNFSFTYIVRGAFNRLASRKDADETEAFFKEKDTSKYALVLQQTLDTIRANADWIYRSTDDVEKWLSQWK